MSYAAFDIDADGAPELIIDCSVVGSGDRVYRFYALRRGDVEGVGEIESELIEDWIGDSPAHKGVAARISIADMEIYSIYALGDRLELRCGLSKSVAPSDETDTERARYAYVVNGVTSDLPAEEWEAFQANLQEIKFLPLELDFSGKADGEASGKADGGAPMKVDVESIGPGTLAQTQLSYLREAFEVPDEIVIADYEYDPDGSYYWEGAGIWIVDVALFSGDQCVGSALAYADTLEPVRQVRNFPGRVDQGMSDPSQMIWR